MIIKTVFKYRLTKINIKVFYFYSIIKKQNELFRFKNIKNYKEIICIYLLDYYNMPSLLWVTPDWHS